ncbi:hypothetical protein D3C81_1802530 [compost metagenome]
MGGSIGVPADSDIGGAGGERQHQGETQGGTIFEGEVALQAGAHERLSYIYDTYF